MGTGHGEEAMSTIRIRKKLDSETLHLPELKPLLGRTVEITVEEQLPVIRDEFYAEATQLPETEQDLEVQKAVFRNWRSDPRSEPYWRLLDSLLARDLATVRKWAAIRSQLPLEDYDYDAPPRAGSLRPGGCPQANVMILVDSSVVIEYTRRE